MPNLPTTQTDSTIQAEEPVHEYASDAGGVVAVLSTIRLSGA